MADMQQPSPLSSEVSPASSSQSGSSPWLHMAAAPHATDLAVVQSPPARAAPKPKPKPSPQPAAAGVADGAAPPKEKRRKTSRACLLCQTSHMHCDAGTQLVRAGCPMHRMH
jgi:hypothetical protein